MEFRVIFAFVTLWSTTLALCPDKCACDNVNLIVTCIRAGLEVMPNTLNPRLQTIVYKYNNFPMVDVSLRFLSELVMVDLSHNHIVSVTNNAFASQASLKSLKLDSNKIGTITNKTFVGLNRLEVLSFRNNEVAMLPENLFIHAPKLQKIDLARNRIATVNEKTFERLESLEILHLEDNFLNSIPTEAFRPIQTLAELYISGNPLLSLPANAFFPFKSLNILDLSSCQIRTVDELAFRGLGTLRRLKLSDNNLTEIPSTAFQNIHGVKGFDIGRNPFDTIPTDGFKFLPQLKHLEISGCQHLTEIMAGAFSDCINLEYVIISMNHALTRIDPAAFDAVPLLRHINLSDNKLKNIAENLVPWRHLRSLDLFGNPWQCDCDMAFAPDVLRYLREKSDELNTTQEFPEDSFVPEFPVKSAQIVAGNCASPESQHALSLYDFKPSCPFLVRSSSTTASNNSVGSFKNDEMDHTNGTVVIISVSIVVSFLFLFVTFFICIKCRSKYSDWAKRHRLWQHQMDHTSPAISSLGSSDTKPTSLRKSPHYADNLYYPSPYKQTGCHNGNHSPYSAYYTHYTGPVPHQQVSHNSAPLSVSDDEYYYVSTSMGDSGAKHIPVTVL